MFSLRRSICSSAPKRAVLPHIFISDPIEDRKSVFVARVACLTGGSAQVDELVQTVREEKKIGKASHPTIYAWTYTNSSISPPSVEQGKHDGGESGAGSVLAGLLDTHEVQDCLVIVTRWYGGTPLGPARFRHISAVGRKALAMGGFFDEGPKTSSKVGRKNGK